jgi:hypothetical protein
VVRSFLDFVSKRGFAPSPGGDHRRLVGLAGLWIVG